jgi:alpha-glucosidase
VPIPPGRVQDPWEKNVPGLGLGRDPARTPMPWTAERHGGFTAGEPWLPLGAASDAGNVAAQAADPRSMLSLYRALLRLRRAEPALSVGAYAPVACTEAVLAYERRHGERRLLVALNMGGRAETIAVAPATGRLRFSTCLDRGGEPLRDHVVLRPHEGLVLERS